MTKKLLILAGGTGGHIYPALAVAKRWQAKGGKVAWIGTKLGLEYKIVPDNGITLSLINIKGIRNKGLLAKLSAPIALLFSFIQALILIFKIQPDVVLGMGGYVSGPSGLAAWCLRKPLIVHEQNAIAGKTNVYLAKLAKRVLCAFPNTFPKDVAQVCGNPVRQEIINIAQPVIEKVCNNILIVGGSRGALQLNELVPAALRLAGDASINVMHQSGEALYDKALNAYQGFEGLCQVIPYIEDMVGAYEWADLVICRSGAMTVFEIMAAGKLALFVPYPYAVDNHQAANANYLVKKEAALMVNSKQLSVEELCTMIQTLRRKSADNLSKAQRAYGLRVVDADVRVCEICWSQASD